MQCDPRTKLIMVMCISSMAVLFNDALWLLCVLCVAVMMSVLFKSGSLMIFWKLKRFAWIFVFMIFIQSIFTDGGEGLVTLGNLTIVSTVGLANSASIFLRISIIITSATVMTTSNSRDIVQGLYQWKIPYELAFMVSVAIRFLPMLKEEVIDMMTAIQLRGINLKKIPKGTKIKIYSYLIMPMIASVILKAKELAIAVEMRGLRACSNRTSYRQLKLGYRDYVSMVIFCFSTGAVIFKYFS
ncbi:energy-coupling factor transporter transmembrane component T [Proteinivorax hydrogeniformans]|uniref:Energy-coupling factor transporter transmembrane component T n=1 Tax=Proteinivorax hydrogeniformans TaxID=1826727 RepID=A0AAU8HT43_9FIRM